MLRTGASRLALRSIAAPSARPVVSSFIRTTKPVQWNTEFSSVASKRPQILSMAQMKPIQVAVLRRALSDKIDLKAEKRYSQEKLKPSPETVSAYSTTHPLVGEVGRTNPQAEVDMMAGVKGDVTTIKETFDLSEVPRQAYLIGLAGVLPYLATSLSTVVCAYEINHSVAGYGYLLSTQTAETLLHFLEPLQIGYGAVILSFLGAIHWGLEWAGYGGYQGYRRYAIGVLAPAIAWPTILMPVEYALITQLSAFVMLYYVDTRASYKGWTPPWYAIYRFVLTFIVGASIVVSLIGRGEVAEKVGRIPGAVDRITALREDAQKTLAKEEEAIRIQNAAKAGSDDEKEEDEEEGKEENSEKAD
ncbi:hypothetical protein BU24DRAFT_85032 [Aaosphaeria arxii CBS 175.79]|uniref:Transmembrane protein 69 n=1 Tax=Aaosphaeria arxii CBS 175.79 TaxID=1450172 RepID=A0A6A5X8J7_9PLEO|nr:uncharacterized protein BU24DRAFT_85032 [Aaosphaeria arxii CBS 175.79]KAF2009219.1 hypothetical protein BU24DRAFT_85032 [Aaosphaeria arxii CBS 175.79]